MSNSFFIHIYIYILYAQYFIIIKKKKIIIFRNDFDDHKILEHNSILIFFKDVKEYFCREKRSLKNSEYYWRLIESKETDFGKNQHKKNLLKEVKPTHPEIEPTLIWYALTVLTWHAAEPAQDRSEPALSE